MKSVGEKRRKQKYDMTEDRQTDRQGDNHRVSADFVKWGPKFAILWKQNKNLTRSSSRI